MKQSVCSLVFWFAKSVPLLFVDKKGIVAVSVPLPSATTRYLLLCVQCEVEVCEINKIPSIQGW
jgi:hypothetical protein